MTDGRAARLAAIREKVRYLDADTTDAAWLLAEVDRLEAYMLRLALRFAKAIALLDAPESESK
jgi:hypothetical protein